MWHNSLFDLLLLGFGKATSLHAAEKIAVSLGVLIFFWGAFSFIGAVSGKAPWYLVPCLGVFAYGWTFEAGFMNYYFSLGLSFLALAIFWAGRGWEKALALALAPLVLLGHAIGLAWLLGAVTYLWCFRRLHGKWRYGLLAAGIAGLVLLRWFLYHHYIADPEAQPFYWFTGADQLAVGGPWYWGVAIGFLVLAAIFILLDFKGKSADSAFQEMESVSVHLYILVVVGAFLLPDGIHVPPYSAALALITPRLTLIAAVVLCTWLGTLRPRRIHLLGFGAIAVLFFAMLYRDTGMLNSMEARIEQLVRTLPANQRVLGTILPPDDSRFIVQHMLDRACIGHCFSYGNYEPPSGAFRVRVLDTNPYQMEDGDSTAEMEDGSYVVKPEDLPAYQVFQCGPSYPDLCIRALASGEENDRGAFHPGR